MTACGRRSWSRSRPCASFRKLVRNKEDTVQVFEIMRALSGRFIARETRAGLKLRA